MTRLTLQAPATIANVGPGFDIFAFALESPVDRFRIFLTDTPGEISIRFRGGEGDIPVDPDQNTAGLAARHILAGLKTPVGAEIEIIKGMPSCAGLGSSAASAVAGAFGLSRLLKPELSRDEVLDAARLGETASGGTAHADNVAACLLGGFVFIRGSDPLDIVGLPLPDIPIVLRVMRKSKKTTRGSIPSQFSLADLKLQMALCANVVYALTTGDIEAFGRAINRDLVSEPVRSSHIPGYDRLKKEVLGAGAFGFNVSGGGSSVFAVPPPEKTEEIAALMRSHPDPEGRTTEVIITRTSGRGIQVTDEL